MGVADPVVEAALIAAEAGVDVLRGTDFALLGNADRLDVLERLEHVGRTIPGVGHELVAELEVQGAVAEFPYGGMSPLLAETLRVRFVTARKMIAQAKVLAVRSGIGGAPLPAVYPLVAGAQRGGLINADHVGVILKFFDQLPDAVSAADRQSAEAQLVELAKVLRPEQLAAAAARLMAHLNPDGSLDDERERRKEVGFWMGPQDADGLTRGTFCFDARLRVMFEAFFAKFARPGMCNPEDEVPMIIPEPEPEPEPPSPPLPVRKPVRARRGRSCPMCGGDVGEDGKAASGSDPGAGAGAGAGDGGLDAAGRVNCSGHSHSHDPGRGDVPPAPHPDPVSATDAHPEPAAVSVPELEPRSTPTPTPDQDPDQDNHQDPELDLGLLPAAGVPALGPAPGAASGPAGPDSGPTGHDAAALSAAAARDLRPYWLRNADALAFGFNSLLSDPGLGQHRGLPVTAVITMTVKDLEAATGKALSGGGTIIPIRDAIRMAAHAYQYLLVFDDDGRPLYLGRGKRLATADQRLVLYAGDRGCTFPGCPRPGYYCQSHHLDEWVAAHGCSDIDRLTFACEVHHRLIGPGVLQWRTSTAPPGGVFGLRTLWHPPVFMDPLRLGRVNHFHHPDEYLRETPEFPGPDGEPPPQRE